MRFWGTAKAVVWGAVCTCPIEHAIAAARARSALTAFVPNWPWRIVRHEGEVSACARLATETEALREAHTPLNTSECMHMFPNVHNQAQMHMPACTRTCVHVYMRTCMC